MTTPKGKRPPTFGPDGRHFSAEYLAWTGGPIVEQIADPTPFATEKWEGYPFQPDEQITEIAVRYCDTYDPDTGTCSH